MADEHGRDNVGEIELALDKDNRFVALRLDMLANIGAYVGSDRNLLSPFGMIGTVLGVDRIELRRKNMLPESALPYQSPVGPFYDCGKFEENMDMALKLADVAGFK